MAVIAMPDDGDAPEQPQERPLATEAKRYGGFEGRQAIVPVGDGFLPPYSARDSNGDSSESPDK
jgi:hypothetical protein